MDYAEEKNTLEIEIISRCISGDATEEEKKKVLYWINENPENEKLYFIMKDLYGAGSLQTLKNEADTLREWNRLKNKIKYNNSSETKPISRFSYATLLKYAAVLVIGVFTTIIVDGTLKFTSQKKNVSSVNKVITGKSERSKLILPDGTEVWLDVCSSISYDQDYGNKFRKINLVGQAYFKVTKNPSVPFIVTAGGFNVRALGTAFNVSAYKEDNQVLAVLEEGSISFGREDTDEPEIIKPGQMIRYSNKSNSLSIENVDTRLYTAWRDGEYRFDQLSFGEVAKRLSQFYKVTFIFQNQKIKNIPFTGTFKSYESIGQILDVIQTNTLMKYRIKNDTIYIK